MLHSDDSNRPLSYTKQVAATSKAVLIHYSPVDNEMCHECCGRGRQQMVRERGPG